MGHEAIKLELEMVLSDGQLLQFFIPLDVLLLILEPINDALSVFLPLRLQVLVGLEIPHEFLELEAQLLLHQKCFGLPRVLILLLAPT